MSAVQALDRVNTSLMRAQLWHLVVIALVVRGVWILLCPNTPSSDQVIYHAAATDLAAGRGYVDESGNPAGYWAVGYAAFLAPFYRIFGAAPVTAFGANALLGLVAVAGVFLVTRDLLGRRAARVATLAIAGYPSLVLYCTCIASENAFIAATVWFAYFVVRLAKDDVWLRWAIAAGVAAGLGAYVRPTMGLLCLIAPVAIWPHRGWGAAVARSAAVAVIAGAILLPWTLRNRAQHGVFAPVSLNASANLWMGNHPGSDGSYTGLPEAVREMTLVERERWLGERARRFIRENPGTYLWLCVRRVVSTLRSDTIAVVWNEAGIRKRIGPWAETPLKIICTGVHLGVLCLAVVGLLRSLWVSWRRNRFSLSREQTLLLLANGLLAAPFILIIGGNRYHLPVIPFAVMWVVAIWLQREDNDTATGRAQTGG